MSARGIGRPTVVQAIDAELAGTLPPLIRSDQPAGILQERPAQELGLKPGVLVSAGGGDNMMGAIGTGNTRAGRRHRELRHQRHDLRVRGQAGRLIRAGEIAAFCDSTNRWLPLLCTMNVTVATEMVREDFGLTHEKFAAEAAKIRPGRAACCCCRISKASARPTCPTAPASGSASTKDFRRRLILPRAAMEGVTLGMNYGLRRLRELGVKPAPNPRHRRRGEVEILAADHGGRFRRGSGDAESERRRGLRRGFAGALVLALAARRNGLHQRHHG